MSVYQSVEMAKRQSIIPKAPLGRILMNQGAKRVSADALDKMEEILSSYAEEIGTRAWEIAKHSGRKTIHEEDIKLASRD